MSTGSYVQTFSNPNNVYICTQTVPQVAVQNGYVQQNSDGQSLANRIPSISDQTNNTAAAPNSIQQSPVTFTGPVSLNYPPPNTHHSNNLIKSSAPGLVSNPGHRVQIAAATNGLLHHQIPTVVNHQAKSAVRSTHLPTQQADNRYPSSTLLTFANPPNVHPSAVLYHGQASVTPNTNGAGNNFISNNYINPVSLQL